MKHIYFSILLLIGLTFSSCEEEFIPPIIDIDDAIVVEGYIEAGDAPTPPYILLTKSFPFFSEISRDQLNESFIHDALVSVSNGSQEVQLTEICLNDIPEELREQADTFLGTSIDSIGFNFCLYVDFTFSMVGEEGKTYDLEIIVGDETLTATTTIPYAVPLDSIFFTPPPGESNDTLAQLRVFLDDPANENNFYRYFTSVDNGPYLRPFNSILDDLLFDGQFFEMPLVKAESTTDDFDPDTFGLFHVGDTMSLKWMLIDQPHFNFWNTLEFSRANQGPFASYTRIDHNIEGGLGIWGGISARHYDRIVEY